MSDVLKTWHRYLPVTPEEGRRALYAIGVGYALIPPRHPYPPAQHPSDHHFTWIRGRVLHEFQLILIHGGGGVFESRATGRRRLRPGSMILLFPGQWHRYSPDRATGWDEYWIAFGGRRAAEWMAEHGFDARNPVVEPGGGEALLHPYLRAIEETRAGRPGFPLVVASCCVELVAQAAAALRRQAFGDAELGGRIESAKRRMHDVLDASLDLRRLARDLHVGYSWFRRKFKAYTGFAPKQYHLQLRLNRGRELLRDTRLPVGEIAVRAGFDSVYYFSRVFRRKTGQTPSAYRASSQGAGT